MPLIACPECASHASISANICPHCGYPIMKRRPPSAGRSFLAVFFSIPTLAALVAVVSLGASPWIAGPVWAATMAFMQWALIVQRREWKARYVVPIATAETPSENARRTAGEPSDEATT